MSSSIPAQVSRPARPRPAQAETEAAPSVDFEWEGKTVQWRPGRVIVRGALTDPGPLLAGLTEFAFYEGELRALERELAICEAGADDDVRLAYRISASDKEHWPRIADTIEHCARLRLAYARLTPYLERSSRALPVEVRRVLARLRRGTDVTARLEAFSDRLEACEDLYEGANDRIADFRGWHNGHILEVGILVFIIFEAIIMSVELALHVKEYLAD
jgi:hypothetical protein